MSEQYKMVAENPQSTVVSDYEPRYRTAKQYQSEVEMEKGVIEPFVNDLSEGLPAEIAAVQEQYEYYHNKLLVFRRIEKH